jgi:hypothetical protein
MFPEAMEETMTLGIPTGRVLIALAPMAVPEPPPREMTPEISPLSKSSRVILAAPSAMTATACPRSPWPTRS